MIIGKNRKKETLDIDGGTLEIKSEMISEKYQCVYTW